MAAIIWDDVVAFAPELSTLDVDAQTDILAHVNTALDVGVFGGESSPKLKLARIYLAAHFGKLASQGGSSVAGPVISESAGGLSRSYANLFSAGTGGLRGSLYGDLFNELVQTTIARLPLVL